MQAFKLFPILSLVLCFIQSPAQTNLLENGGFEADWSGGHHPISPSILFTNCPYPWLDFNPGDDERWFTDSIWPGPVTNLPDPNYQHGYWSQSSFPSNSSPNGTAGAPWEDGLSMNLQSAFNDRCFVGIDLRSDWPNREGIQTKMQNDCVFNSGDYTVSLRWARPYPEPRAKFFISLSDQSSNRRKRVASYRANVGAYNSGEWNLFSSTFELKPNRNKDIGNKWFAITGRSVASDNPRHYMFLDDIRLYRQCDIDSACFRPTGQICPSIGIQAPPNAPFVIQNIGNANSLRIRVWAGNGGNVLDTTYANPNGLPDFYMPAALLSTQLASSTYQYEITLSNKCGAVEKSGSFTVFNGIYDTLAPWVDTTANWSETPIECCLHTLTLRDMEIRGNVSYIVKDTIWVAGGVTAADSSDILIQAGQVVELDSVEFDGATSSVEIVEAPCQGCRLAPPVPGGIPPSEGEIGRAAVIAEPWLMEESEKQGRGAGKLAHGEMELEEKADPASLYIHPNPTQGQFAMTVVLPNPTRVDLAVLDADMRTVAEVVDGKWLWSGSHGFQADLAGLPAGMYFVRLRTMGEEVLEKVVRQ